MELKEVIKTLPKTELHCHLDGSIRPQTVLEIANKDKIQLPSYDINEIDKAMKIYGLVKDLKEYLTKFDIPQRVMQTKENIIRITEELLEDASKSNIKYIEIRYAPVFHTSNGLSINEVIEAVNEGVRLGYEKYGVIANQIICCMRHMKVEENIKVVESAKEFLGRGVVAIDLAGNEADFPPEIHKEVFDKAKDYGFHITIHGGETGEEQNIIKSIELLHAERIGHGVCAINDEKVVDYLVENKIPLEVCITSNVHTKIVDSFKNHPVKYYLDKGVKITLNVDNSTVSNTTLNDEYFNLIEKHNVSKEELIRIIRNGIDSAFCTIEQRKELLETFNNALEMK